MGGAAFKDGQGKPLTTSITRDDVVPTLDHFLRAVLEPLGIPSYEKLGSTGKKASSGDLDIAVGVGTEDVTKFKKAFVEKAGQILEPDRAKALGQLAVIRYPIVKPTGEVTKDNVQIDVMFTPTPENTAWMMSGVGEGVKGVYRNLMLAHIAKQKSQGDTKMTISFPGGLQVKKGSEVVVPRTNDPDEVLKLLGIGVSRSEVQTFEDLVRYMASEPSLKPYLKTYEQYIMPYTKKDPDNAQKAVDHVDSVLGVQESLRKLIRGYLISESIDAHEESRVRNEKNVNESIRHLVRSILSEAGVAAERQEYGLIDSINGLASSERPIEVKSAGETIPNVVAASKVAGMNSLGKEPYTDVQLHLLDGTTLNISAKGSSAPSLAGGGLVALNHMLPNLVADFLNTAVDELLAQGYKKGDVGVPDVYGQISSGDAIMILAGDKAMGGPIDYMYQGPMDVIAEYCDIDGECSVTVNGAFTSIEDYAASHVLYLRARKRRNDQPFDPGLTDRAGLPSIFGRSPSKGDSNRRIVITDKVPSGAIVVSI